MAQFVGRASELSRFKDLLDKKNASLVTIQGRRRIGKSTLVRHFCKKEKLLFFEFQGLPPTKKITNKDQLDEFSKSLAKYLSIEKVELKNWTQGFEQLNTLYLKNSKGVKKIVILIDEISWMGAKDSNFAGYFKDVWDRVLNSLDKLIVILCGSVSSWIEKNILQNTGYVGRVSKEFKLSELSISESVQMLQSYNKKFSNREFAQILSITGGVPKYIEEFSPYKTIAQGIREICFLPSGFLFSELEKIFSEIFGKKNTIYLTVLYELNNGPLAPVTLAEKVGHPLNGDWNEIIFNLELAGFIKRDYSWNLVSNKTSKINRLRISDNYSKFYFKYIQPRKEKLIKLPLKTTGSLDFLNWDSVFGYQFENLILNNLSNLIVLLKIQQDEVVQLGPYYQSSTKRKEGLQIDCLIHCKKGLLYICEFKTSEHIGLNVVNEVQRKTEKLNLPRGFSTRHVLVYLGTLSEELIQNEYFDHLISFEDFC